MSTLDQLDRPAPCGSQCCLTVRAHLNSHWDSDGTIGDELLAGTPVDAAAEYASMRNQGLSPEITLHDIELWVEEMG